MAKLTKRRKRFPGDKMTPDAVTSHRILRGFAAKQRPHVKQEMPPRAERKS